MIKLNLKEKFYKQKEIYYITYKNTGTVVFDNDASLSDKADFYRVANLFSDAIKKIVSALNDYIVIGNNFFRKKNVFLKVGRIRKSYDCYNNLRSYIKRIKKLRTQMFRR